MKCTQLYSRLSDTNKKTGAPGDPLPHLEIGYWFRDRVKVRSQI